MTLSVLFPSSSVCTTMYIAKYQYINEINVSVSHKQKKCLPLLNDISLSGYILSLLKHKLLSAHSWVIKNNPHIHISILYLVLFIYFLSLQDRCPPYHIHILEESDRQNSVSSDRVHFF